MQRLGHEVVESPLREVGRDATYQLDLELGPEPIGPRNLRGQGTAFAGALEGAAAELRAVRMTYEEGVAARSSAVMRG